MLMNMVSKTAYFYPIIWLYNDYPVQMYLIFLSAKEISTHLHYFVTYLNFENCKYPVKSSPLFKFMTLIDSESDVADIPRCI